MEQQENIRGSRRFGSYLRRVREGRRLSLDAVEELSSGYAERVTKSHLSRIENGQALPSFPRLFALGRIYGVPVSSLAERFEVEFQREQTPLTLETRSDEQLLSDARKLRMAGRYAEALACYTIGLERMQESRDAAREGLAIFRLGQITCLVHLNRYEFAKAECEELLGDRSLGSIDRLKALQLFVICCIQMSRFAVALMGLEQARKEVDTPGAPVSMRADLEALGGQIHVATGHCELAIPSFELALRIYEQLPNTYEACRSKINLAAALMEAGDKQTARQHLESAITVAETEGYDRLRALAISHLAVLAYEGKDLLQAEAFALRSNAIAREREFISLVFRNCYYLWKIAGLQGDLSGARSNERALRTYLSRVEEFLPEAEAFRAYMAGGEA